MNKIFEGAKFGDKFKTRDGRMAIFVYSDGIANVCVVKNVRAFWAYTDFGECFAPSTRDMDIVGRWDESIDEEKLDRLADSELDDAFLEEGQEGQRYAAEYGFKLGYRKAKEEL